MRDAARLDDARRPRDAALAVSIGNPGLEHFDSDGGVELNFGLTDSSGQPVGNLKPDNVKVFEDGKQAKILDFRGVGQGRPVDIVFVLDVTESMQPYIDAVKQNVIQFCAGSIRQQRDYRLGPSPSKITSSPNTRLQLRLSKQLHLRCAYLHRLGQLAARGAAAVIFPRINSTRSPTPRVFRSGLRRKASS